MRNFLTAFTIAIVALTCSCTTNNKHIEDQIDFIAVELSDSSISKNPQESWRFVGSVELPENSDSTVDIKTLRNSIVANIFGGKFTDRSNRRLLRAYRDSLLEQNKQNAVYLDQFQEDEPVVFGFYAMVNGKAHFQSVSDSLLSYSTMVYLCPYGACGNHEMHKNRIYDLGSYTTVSTDDIFMPGYESRLTSIITRHPAIRPDTTAVDTAFSLPFDSFRFTNSDNLLLDDRGLTITYNPYTIACGAVGTINIALPTNEIADIIDTTSTVGRFLLK